jgi:hypothetical protein
MRQNPADIPGGEYRKTLADFQRRFRNLTRGFAALEGRKNSPNYVFSLIALNQTFLDLRREWLKAGHSDGQFFE